MLRIMSYRSIKRIFGETRLELKLLFLFAVGLLTVIAGSFWLYGFRTARLVFKQNDNTCKLLVDQSLIAKHIGGMRDMIKRPVYLTPPPDESTTNPDILFDTFMAKSLSRQPHKVELIPPEQAESKLANDERGQKVIEKFLHAPPETPASRDRDEGEGYSLPGGQEYQYFEPIRARDKCLEVCHASPPGGSGIDAQGSGVSIAGSPSSAAGPRLVEGDIMAIAKVTISNEEVQRKLDKNWALLWACAIAAVFLAMVTSYAIVRYVIVKPLRHLRDVSDAISRGNLALRAEIHTGDEFEHLATAFNRMLRHLVTIQNELRQANVNLDGKLDELARANMQLYELNQFKSDFLATISHELRTPLNSILGFSDVLASADALDDKQQRYVTNIQTSGRTLLDMINDILDLAKMESGKMDVRLADFRIAQVVDRAVRHGPALGREEEHRPGDRPGARSAAHAAGPGAGAADPQQPALERHQVHTRGGPRNRQPPPRRRRLPAAAGYRHGRGHCRGGPADHLREVPPGPRRRAAGDAMTREYSGSGLGLSIVKELCKLLGGTVSVASELGKGSTFTVRLPWTLQEPPRPAG